LRKEDKGGVFLWKKISLIIYFLPVLSFAIKFVTVLYRLLLLNLLNKYSRR